MRRLYQLYQVTMIALSLAIIWLVTLPNNELWVRQVNQAIWIIFLVDYLIRLRLSPLKRRFIEQNVPDLVAVLPLDYLVELLLTQDTFGFGRLFRLARFVKVLWLFRAGVVLWRASYNLRGILETNGLLYVLMIAIGMILIGGTTIWLVEPEIGSIGDGIWWSIVTTTTVGYGDISPVTMYGRIVATILMIVGIGTIGMITGTITTYFLGKKKPSNPHIVHIITELERWEELTPRERCELANLLKAMAEVPEAEAPKI